MNFKPVFVEGTNLDDTWFQLLYQLWEKGRKYEITSGSHAGSNRLAFDFVSGFIKYPHTRPLAPIMPEGTDLHPPTTDEKIDSYFADYIMDPHLEPDEEYRYSSWIAGGNDICKVNQTQWIIDHFKKHGYGNEHCYLNVSNPDSCLAYDRPFKSCKKCNEFYPPRIKNCPKCGEELNIDEAKRGTSPCLRGLDFRIIDGYLMTHVIYRSWDLWAGFPENMGGFTLLNEFIANNLEGVEPGPLSFSCKSLHAYEHHVGIITKRLNKEFVNGK